MLRTHVAERRHTDLGGYDDGQWFNADADPFTV